MAETRPLKAISVGDVHMSDVAPVGRQDDYALSIMSKLIEIVELAKSIGAIVIFVGDIFHRRRFNDYRLIAAMIKLLREVPCYGIYGNHDWDPRTQDIKSQPINVLFSSGAIKRLSADSTCVNMPVGTDWVEIKGLDYTRDVALDKIAGLKWDPQSKFKILVLHAMIVPTGTTFYGESVTVDQIKTEADLVLIGHPHWDQGVMRHGKTQFCNFGATARLYRSEADRTVQVGMYDFAETLTISSRPIQCVKPVDEVFQRPVEVLKEGKKMMLVESIVQAVNSQTSFDINSMNIPVELKDTVDHYLLLAKQEKG